MSGGQYSAGVGLIRQNVNGDSMHFVTIRRIGMKEMHAGDPNLCTIGPHMGQMLLEH